MAMNLNRRLLLAAAAGSVLPLPAQAAGHDSATIGWPTDVSGWDPTLRFSPDAQGIYKMVFDQPLTQSPKLKLIANVVDKWQLSPDARTLDLELRPDVLFQDGTKMTSEDIRYTFFDRPHTKGVAVDVSKSFRSLTGVDTPSPTHAVMHFSQPFPTAPVWLAFLGSFVLPKEYLSKVGTAEFVKKPIGSGPYRLVEYEINARIVLERNEKYWGPKPAVRRITIQIIKDASARVAAIQSGQVDLTINVPVREALRLGRVAGLASELDPITRIILLQVRNDRAFADENVRLACHHAIDKEALSKAFYNGAAVPLSLPAPPGSPGFVPDYHFAYDPKLAMELLAKSGWSPKHPVKIGFDTTNGQFPSDYDMARAIAQMWEKVGIKADLNVIEYAQYFELERGDKLPEATLYSFDNATGDPEIYSGYLLNPKLPFSPWKGEQLGKRVIAQFTVTNEAERIAGWKKIEEDAVNMGACMPLLQSVITLVHKKDLDFTRYGNGWVLGQTFHWA